MWFSTARDIWDHRNKIVFRQGKVDVKKIFIVTIKCLGLDEV